MKNKNVKDFLKFSWSLRNAFGCSPKHAHHSHATRRHNLTTNLPCAEKYLPIKRQAVGNSVFDHRQRGRTNITINLCNVPLLFTYMRDCFVTASVCVCVSFSGSPIFTVVRLTIDEISQISYDIARF